MKRRPFLYIAGPYRGRAGNTDQMENCHIAAHVWHQCWVNKVFAICPHWSGFQQAMFPMPTVNWLSYTMGQLMLCSAVYRIAGQSSGSDAEVAAARDLGIPVFHDLSKAIEYMQGISDGKQAADCRPGCCAEDDEHCDCRFCKEWEGGCKAHPKWSRPDSPVRGLADSSSRGDSFGVHGSFVGPGIP